MDVSAAEPVDRLLRVADQDQRGVPAERASRSPATAPGRCPGTRRPCTTTSAAASVRGPVSLVGHQGFGQPIEQVVVAEDAFTTFTAIHFVEDILANRSRTAATESGSGPRAAAGRMGRRRPRLAIVNASLRVSAGAASCCPKCAR